MLEYELMKEASEKGKAKLQTALIIGGFVIFIIILTVVGYYIYKAIKGDDLVKQSKKEIKDKNLTLENSEYEAIASAIYNSMQGWATNEENIYRNLKRLQNADDWKMLIATFGKKDGMNLVEWLTDELDDSEIEIVNGILMNFQQSI